METCATTSDLPVGSADSSPVGLPSGSPARLLVVEDHGYTAVMVCMILKMAGYEVHSAASVAEAAQFLQSEPIDLVLTDWMLPDGTGADVCLTARSVKPAMPLVIFSGLDPKQEPQMTTCQADDYLVKPLGIETLRPTVERLLARQ